MNTLILGLIVFFAVHSTAIINAPWRDRMAGRMGEWTWKAVYGLIAIIGLLLIPVFPLLFAAYLPGRIQSATKHPMLAATKFWALAHLLVNGTVPDVLLFGAFLVWAVTDRISLKYRTAPSMPSLSSSRFNDIAAVVLGLGLYVAFILGLHAWLIGVPVIAR